MGLAERVLTHDEGGMLIHHIKEQLIDHSPIGCPKRSQVEGGVWWSLNGPLVWGMVPYDEAEALDQYKRNMMYTHASVYPDIWYGIWSGPDVYESFLSRYPGHTRLDDQVLLQRQMKIADVNQTLQEKINSHGQWVDTSSLNLKDEVYSYLDFPILNAHCHAWPLYAAFKLLQVDFDAASLSITPLTSVSAYKLHAPLLSVIQDGTGLSGHYAPVAAASYTIYLHTKAYYKRCIVNGQKVPLCQIEDGYVITGEAAPVLTWQLQ